ncbi:MAG: cobalt transporter CbiM [Desulfatirhabdiaceae bacterium]
MHISDGVLPTVVSLGGYAAGLAIAAWSAKQIRPDDLPRVAVVTSAFFVASLVHVPIGPTSVHLLIPGLVGILLGNGAFLSISLGIALQSLLFQFGGLTAIGANAVMMGIPALISGWLFRALSRNAPSRRVWVGAATGGLGVFLSVLMLALLLMTGGEDFVGVAKIAMYAHLPVLAIETAISGIVVSFLIRVKPELLDDAFTSSISGR